MDQKNLSLKIFFDEWEKFDESENWILCHRIRKKKFLTRELIIEEEKWKKDFFE